MWVLYRCAPHVPAGLGSLPCLLRLAVLAAPLLTPPRPACLLGPAAASQATAQAWARAGRSGTPAPRALRLHAACAAAPAHAPWRASPTSPCPCPAALPIPCSAIILDNYSRGRRKSVWVSTSTDLYADAVRDLRDLGSHIEVGLGWREEGGRQGQAGRQAWVVAWGRAAVAAMSAVQLCS